MKQYDIVDIRTGRQLFVDTWLIEETDLTLQVHQAKKLEGNPVFFPQTLWETENAPAVACPKSGGIWWDSSAGHYKMWYEAGWLKHLALAVSEDGIHWERPDLGIVPGTNLLLNPDEQICVLCPDGSTQRLSAKTFRIDSISIWPDPVGRDGVRWRGFFRRPSPPGSLYDSALIACSRDGIHWESFRYTTPVGDRSTIYYDSFRRHWVYSLRDYERNCRIRRRRVCEDLEEGAIWQPEEAVKWLGCDPDEVNPYGGPVPQLYNTDVQAYESVLIGMFQIWYGPDNEECMRTGIPKCTELQAMVSRDGLHFKRFPGENLIRASRIPGTWDRGYIQSVTGGIISYKDEIRIYYTGFCGDGGRITDSEFTNGMYYGGSLGIATLRRDGFMSIGTKWEGKLITRLMYTDAHHFIYVNMDGFLRVEILASNGAVLAVSPWQEIHSTCARLSFSQNSLPIVPEKPFRLRFFIRGGQLYSFWVTDSPFGGGMRR